MKLAFSSDNHLDVNRVDPKTALDWQVQSLVDQQVDYYFFAGDLFNDFTQTRDYFTKLRERLAGQVAVYYIAGNHDLLNHAPYSLVEQLNDPAYLHNRFVDLPGTNWRVIGNNGWYDYSMSAFVNQPTKVRQWKNAYWLDSVIDQPGSDQERMQTVLDQVGPQLTAAKQAHKQVMFLTHFAPCPAVLGPKPAGIKTAMQNYFYQMFKAMTGSRHLGELLESSSVVKKVFYGHLHNQHPTISQGGVTYYHQAVGVRNKRINEWQAANFFDQWQQTLRIIEIRKR